MIRTSLILFFVLFSSIEKAQACSCLRFESAVQHVNSTDVIFEGIAQKPSKKNGLPGDEGRMTEFEVTRAIKGSVKGKAEVFHSSSAICCLCGVSFAAGETYLIFGHTDENEKIYTSSCSSPQFPIEAYELAFEALQ